jgi:putative tryptophan/tyrosine transport system substrate-binding protein
MDRRDILALFGGSLAWPLAARAQDRALPAIGFLSSGSPRTFEKFKTAFLQGLGDQKFAEGREFRIDYRWAEGRYTDLTVLASHLVHDGASLIASSGGVVSAQAAVKATSKIPIVFVVGFDPVQLGLVASLNRPGGNVTGASVYSTELTAKRLEFLVELAPGIRSVGMLVNPGSVTTDLEVKETIAAARHISRDLQVFRASSENEINGIFATAAEQHVGGLLVSADPLFTARRAQIVALAEKSAIPAMYPWREYVESGGLMSYGAELIWAYRQIGNYAGQILKGAHASDLPVVLPTKFDLVINLKTAKALGINISSSLLTVADETIE